MQIIILFAVLFLMWTLAFVSKRADRGPESGVESREGKPPIVNQAAASDDRVGHMTRRELRQAEKKYDFKAVSNQP